MELSSCKNFRLTNAIFESSQIHTSSSLRSSLVLLPTPKTLVQPLESRCYHVYKHIGVIQILPVHGRHLNFGFNSCQPLSQLSAATLLS